MGDLVFLKPDGFNVDDFKEQELRKITDTNPVFKDFLERNGFRLYICDITNEVIVTDDKDVDMAFGLFVALYKAHRV